MDINRIKSNVFDYIMTYNIDIRSKELLKNIIEGFVCLESYKMGLNNDYGLEFVDKINFKEFEIKSEKTKYYKKF